MSMLNFAPFEEHTNINIKEPGPKAAAVNMTLSRI